MTTSSQIRSALASVGGVGGQGWPYGVLATGADAAMAQSGIDTSKGAAVFVGQCMVESAYFRTTREYGGSSARYAPYYGRGFIQVTWRDNYASFGKWCKARGLISNANYFVDGPDRLADPKWAWLGAVWYFTTHRHGLVALANRGENVKVGRAINRGDAHSRYAAYGEGHRQASYNALLRAGITAPKQLQGIGSVITTPATKATIARFQRALGAGWAIWSGGETGKDDGVWGPATEAQALRIRDYLASGRKPDKWSRKRGWRLTQSQAARDRKRASTKAARRSIQWALGVKTDGVWGPQTDAAFLAFRKDARS